jgi:hypothetical protein
MWRIATRLGCGENLFARQQPFLAHYGNVMADHVGFASFTSNNVISARAYAGPGKAPMAEGKVTKDGHKRVADVYKPGGAEWSADTAQTFGKNIGLGDDGALCKRFGADAGSVVQVIDLLGLFGENEKVKVPPLKADDKEAQDLTPKTVADNLKKLLNTAKDTQLSPEEKKELAAALADASRILLSGFDGEEPALKNQRTLPENPFDPGSGKVKLNELKEYVKSDRTTSRVADAAYHAAVLADTLAKTENGKAGNYTQQNMQSLRRMSGQRMLNERFPGFSLKAFTEEEALKSAQRENPGKDTKLYFRVERGQNGKNAFCTVTFDKVHEKFSPFAYEQSKNSIDMLEWLNANNTFRRPNEVPTLI